MEHGLLAGLVLAPVALVALGVLWWRARQAAREAGEASASAREQAHAASAQVAELQGEVERLRSRVCVSQFSADHVYQLLAKSEVPGGPGTQVLGLVELDTGGRQPFLVDAAMEHLQAGDFFSSVHGQLPKLDARSLQGSGASAEPGLPHEAAGSNRACAPDEVPVAAQGDTATPFRAAPGPVTDFEEPPASDQTVLHARKRRRGPAADADAGLPYLEVVEGNDLDAVFFLPFGEVTIGRDRSNDIVLNDEGSSRTHCEVVFRAHRFLLRDRGSTNGTLCNGEQVGERWLEFGDRIRVSDTELLFSCAACEPGRDDESSIAALQRCLEAQPDFLDALRLLAFLMERNVAYAKHTGELWRRIAELEKTG